MPAELMDGSKLAAELTALTTERTAKLTAAGTTPCLASVIVGDDPASVTYVRMKENRSRKVGMESRHVGLPGETTTAELVAVISGLSADPAVHGIIVQLPLERPEETEQVVNLVAPEKDVDGLGVQAVLDPATPLAIMWLLAGYNVELRGKRVLLVGRGRLVGAPLERMLTSAGIDVHVATRETGDLAEQAAEADVIITAAGSPASALICPPA